MAKEVNEADSSEVQSNMLLKGAGIISIVLAVINPPIGLLTSIVTLIWAKKAGEPTKLAAWGMVVSIIMIAIMVAVTIWIIKWMVAAATDGVINMDAVCQHRESWGWLIDSLRYACR